MKRVLVLIASASFVALAVAAGCNSVNGNTGASGNAVDAVEVDAGIAPVPQFGLCPAGGSADAGAETLTDSQILDVMTAANDGEIALGRMAAQLGVSTEVRDFGSRMVADYTAANLKLQQLAASLSLTATPSLTGAQIRAQAQQQANILEAQPAPGFDLGYLDSQVQTFAGMAFNIDTMLAAQAKLPQVSAAVSAERSAAQINLQKATLLQARASGTVIPITAQQK